MVAEAEGVVEVLGPSDGLGVPLDHRQAARLARGAVHDRDLERELAVNIGARRILVGRRDERWRVHERLARPEGLEPGAGAVHFGQEAAEEQCAVVAGQESQSTKTPRSLSRNGGPPSAPAGRIRSMMRLARWRRRAALKSRSVHLGFLPGRQPLWGNVDTLADHFGRHGAAFGAKNADEYSRWRATFWCDLRLIDCQQRIDTDGTIRVYDRLTNTFGSYNPDGTTKTFFKPDTGSAYWDHTTRPSRRMIDMPYVCPVCGYPCLKERPRGDTTGGSYEICPSCGFQFGVTDEDQGYTFSEWRQNWIKKGMPWSSVACPPPQDWDPERQLERSQPAVHQDPIVRDERRSPRARPRARPGRPTSASTRCRTSSRCAAARTRAPRRSSGARSGGRTTPAKRPRSPSSPTRSITPSPSPRSGRSGGSAAIRWAAAPSCGDASPIA